MMRILLRLKGIVAVGRMQSSAQSYFYRIGSIIEYEELMRKGVRRFVDIFL